MIKCNWLRRLGALSIELCGLLVAMSVFFSGARAAEAAAAASDALEEITVTGSLIKDPNHESSSPIVITTTDDLKQSGTLTLESALNQLPQFSPSGTAANGGQGTGGHATVNLHGLGANRNLVLLDGRRLPRDWTASDRSLSQLMMRSLISFAQTGSPASKELPWPAWSEANQQMMVFGDGAKIETLPVARMDWLAAHPPADVPRTGKPRATRD
jgi:hypothetical protein